MWGIMRAVCFRILLQLLLHPYPGVNHLGEHSHMEWLILPTMGKGDLCQMDPVLVEVLTHLRLLWRKEREGWAADKYRLYSVNIWGKQESERAHNRDNRTQTEESRRWKGREEKMLEKCGGQYWGRSATLQSCSWEVSQSISVGVFISLTKKQSQGLTRHPLYELYQLYGTQISLGIIKSVPLDNARREVIGWTFREFHLPPCKPHGFC